MRVVMKRVNEDWKIGEIENDLKALQNFVGGHIQAVPLASDLCIVCNEDGRLEGLPENCIVYGIPFCGDILLIRTCRDEFITMSEFFAESAIALFGRR